jgi:hypothetical protein
MSKIKEFEPAKQPQDNTASQSCEPFNRLMDQLPFDRLKVFECKQYSLSDHTERTMKYEFYEPHSIGRCLTKLGNAFFVYWRKQ